jgi:TRAP-type mannitol/chloroaromatic compound transport system substrate-binding protein
MLVGLAPTAAMKKDYPNIKVKTFPKPVFDALRAANDKLLDELAKKNPLSKEIIKSRHDYLQKIRAWTNRLKSTSPVAAP